MGMYRVWLICKLGEQVVCWCNSQLPFNDVKLASILDMEHLVFLPNELFHPRLSTEAVLKRIFKLFVDVIDTLSTIPICKFP
jgi:hypothetical protein